MMEQSRLNDSVHWFISELTSRVVADSAIPSDRYHLGKIILQCLKDDPDFVLQIDGRTGESETNKSVLQRSIRCAIALTELGLKKGDVMILMAPNHLDLCIPFYAAMYMGIIISSIDQQSKPKELIDTFSVNRPKIIFCQNDKTADIQLALEQLDLDIPIVTFDKGDHLYFGDLLTKPMSYVEIENFRPVDLDVENEIAVIISTSGTSGVPKGAAASHKNLVISHPYLWSNSFKFPSPTRMVFLSAPLLWLTSLANYILTPIMRYTRLQSSSPMSVDHMYDLINKYRPTYAILSPPLMTTLLRAPNSSRCDFTCFELILLGGSHVSKELIEEFKNLTPNTEVNNVYGISEATCLVFGPVNHPAGSCGTPIGCLQYRLIDHKTQKDIYEPNTEGELWLKGPGIVKEYYNNPEETAKVFTEDGWFKTKDLFYRDENYNFFFVERLKMLIKYKNYQISPLELECVIRQHPGILDVAVTCIEESEAGELPVACVIPRAGHVIKAQEIKDLIKNTLSEPKQLRGGVIFLKEFPMTPSMKVNRTKLRKIVPHMQRE